MYILYYQEDKKCGNCCLQGIDPQIEKMCHIIPIFICLSLLPSLAQKLWERFKRLASPTFAETSSQLLFISPSCLVLCG